MGISIQAFLQKLRIEEACKLLTETALPVSEVAASVGFDSLTHFERVFKTIQGVTPREYLRMQRAKGAEEAEFAAL